MGLALALITVGSLLAYSGLKGKSIAEILKGELGNPLDPAGGDFQAKGKGVGMNPPVGDVPHGGKNKWGFKGPNADILTAAATAAETKFNLKITSVLGGTHVKGSLHYKGRAFDASGSQADMAAFAKWLVDNYAIFALEIFFDPSNIRIKDGVQLPHNVGGHTDHVHFAI